MSLGLVEKKFFSAFSQSLQENHGRPIDDEKPSIRNGNKRIRRLDSLARLLINGDSQNCAAVAVYKNMWYITANAYAQIEPNIITIQEGLNKLKYDSDKIVGTTDARKFLFEKFRINENIKTGTNGRLVKDVKKFLSSLKDGSQVFTADEINSLLEDGITGLKNHKGYHAEIKVLKYLVRKKSLNNADDKLTLGISKLCCRLCSAAVSAIVHSKPQNISLRGRHGNFYFEWRLTTLVLNHEESLKTFVGEKAWTIYSKTSNQRKKNIKEILKNLNGNRNFLKNYFTPQRGGVTLNSDSPAPLNTENSKDTKVDNGQSDIPDDSLSQVSNENISQPPNSKSANFQIFVLHQEDESDIFVDNSFQILEDGLSPDSRDIECFGESAS